MAATYKPSLDEVRDQAGQHHPDLPKLPADLETPVSVYLKLCGQGSSNGRGPSFLLSRWKGEQLGVTASSASMHP